MNDVTGISPSRADHVPGDLPAEAYSGIEAVGHDVCQPVIDCDLDVDVRASNKPPPHCRNVRLVALREIGLVGKPIFRHCSRVLDSIEQSQRSKMK